MEKMLKGLVVILCTTLFFTTVLTKEVVYKNQLRHKEYDFIIVGAGTSGSVLANRLSEQSCNNVLVLEAGGVPTGHSEVPLFSAKLIGGQMDWGYLTEPQDVACLQLKDRRGAQPRGKVLGGTSTINGLQYVRGERRDYDEWAKNGATGWAWEDVLPYFKKAEDQTDPDLAKTGLYGVGGPQTLTTTKYGSPLRDAYQEAMEHLGYQMMDINSGSPLGFSHVQGTTRDGLRCSTEKGYLRPIASRPNLDIVYETHVTKIEFDENKRAKSVRFERDNATYLVGARKEIILSAGVFGSAQILMLSGIGPKEHLEELEIPVVSDLPVGENFQDHITVGGLVYVINNSVSLVPSRTINYESIVDMLDGKGPLTVPAGVEILAVANSKYQEASENWPDMRFFFASSVMYPVTDEKAGGLVAEATGRDAFSVHPMVTRPRSRGHVRLASTDPHQQPIIDPRYLTDDYDIKILVEGIRFVERVVSTTPIQTFAPVRIPSTVPGCEDLDKTSEEYLKCWARALTLSSLHPCCTCKMGNPTQSDTVVDPELRVKGVTGLRVVDASVMPDVTSGNTMAPCIMIGEKAADLLKA